MILKDIIHFLEALAPKNYQESYDNSGLICGDKNTLITKAIVCLDTIEEVVDEAISKKANLIIAHHPIVFKGLKSFTGKNYVERVIIKAIKNDIAIYAIHTNLDNVLDGVNAKICEKLGIKHPKILSPKSNTLNKLVFYTPSLDVKEVKDALFAVGAGNIGNYSEASFDSKGTGTFKGNEHSKPTIGKKNIRENAEEVKSEMIFPKYLKNKIIATLIEKHPYEEVAYNIISLENNNQDIGSGMIGFLEEEINTTELFEKIKKEFNCKCIRHTKITKKKITKIAVCGGSGSFLLQDAIQQKADIFITGDFKYHEFFDAENNIIIADIGHFESEQFTNELLLEKMTKKFPTFATLLTEVNTNPVEYYT